jgi:hypothetical protein
MSYYRHNRQPRRDKVTNPEIPSRIKALLDSGDLNEGTKDFMDSLSGSFKKYGGLTPKQFGALAKVEYRYSPEAKKSREEWEAEYDDDMRRVAQICARYYQANPPYFEDLASKVLNDANFVPTRKQYRAMCQNKYAVKVLASTEGDAKYPAGTWVEGRSTSPSDVRGKVCVVIATDSTPVTSAAKGAKTYTLLPLGGVQTITAEERQIKKAKV